MILGAAGVEGAGGQGAGPAMADAARENGAPQFVLASSSPRRGDLLAQYGYRFRSAPADIVESTAGWLTVGELVLLNAGRKATFTSRTHPDSVVLGVDTLVCLDGRPLGKPADLTAAAGMLESLGGREHQVYSGVCLTRQRPAGSMSFVAVTRVCFRPLSAEDVAAYLRRINPLDKAGGYAAQEHADRIIASVRGSWTNVIGLPMEKLTAALAREFGIWPVLPIAPQKGAGRLGGSRLTDDRKSPVP